MRLQDIQGKVDFGIITIREDEFEAVLARFPAAGRVTGRRHYNLRQVELPGGGSYRVAVMRCIEQGNGEAQSAAHDLLEDLQPRWLLVVGIAGGVPSDELWLGDVVVSTRIHDFSVEAVLQARGPEYSLGGGPVDREAAILAANIPALREELGAWNSPASIMAHRPRSNPDVVQYYGEPKWTARVSAAYSRHVERTTPLVAAGPVASSDRLIKDTEVMAVWTKMTRHVLATEMESAGVYRATYGRRVPTLSIRGISDIVGLQRDSAWTPYACHTAAAFALALVRTRPFEPRSLAASATPAEQGQSLEEAHKPRVFIGSSKAGLRVAEFLQLGLEDHAECTLGAHGEAAFGGASLETLERAAQSVNLAVLVLAPEDGVHRSESPSSSRDGALAQWGFFMGSLGRERTWVVYNRDELTGLPAVMAGASTARYGRRTDGDTRAALGPVCTQLKMALERVKRDKGSAGPVHGDAVIQQLSSELVSLRAEFSAQTEHVRRMMELLTAERAPSPEQVEASRLRALEGIWKNPEVGSWGYARFLGGKLRFAYCYGGNDRLTGEYYHWHFVSDALLTRFRWFDQMTTGLVYFDEVSSERLRGGWWFAASVPGQDVRIMPQDRGRFSLEWVRQKGDVFPAWAEAYFKELEAKIEGR